MKQKKKFYKIFKQQFDTKERKLLIGIIYLYFNKQSLELVGSFIFGTNGIDIVHRIYFFERIGHVGN